MRNLTDNQSLALDRIASSPAAANVHVVGWLSEGGQHAPILRTKNGRLAALLPSSDLQTVEEVPS